MIKDYFLNYEAMNNDFTICLGQRHSVTLPRCAHEERDFRITLGRYRRGDDDRRPDPARAVTWTAIRSW